MRKIHLRFHSVQFSLIQQYHSTYFANHCSTDQQSTINHYSAINHQPTYPAIDQPINSTINRHHSIWYPIYWQRHYRFYHDCSNDHDYLLL